MQLQWPVCPGGRILDKDNISLAPEGHAIERSATMKYVCDVCGYEYDEALGDPDHGIAPGTKWEDLPEDFECPLCGVGKDQFSAQ